MWTESARDSVGLPMLQQSDVPVFYLPGRFAKGIRALIEYRHARVRQQETPDPPTKAAGSSRTDALKDLLRSSAGRTLDEHRSKALLSHLAIPTTREVLCASLRDAEGAAAALGYPVALKVASSQIPHKTEARAVRLDVRNAAELADAREAVLAGARAFAPAAAIDGVLVQEMVTGGVEVIVGLSRDPQFGPVLLFGMGGVLVEALGAVSRRLCPITREDARMMIAEVPGMQAMLTGYRGRPAADVDALIEALCSLSRAAVAAGPLLAEVDINPLAVLPKGQGVKALDALVVAGEMPTEAGGAGA